MDYGTNFRSPTVNVHDFSMIPRADIPRSTFRIQQQNKTTINATGLFPVFCTEVLPGDTFKCNMTAYVRMATPIYPLLDNMELESFFFFVPARIVWTHWVNFMGEQPATPSDSISYTIPQIVSATGGFPALSLYDYMGIPTGAQITGTMSVNALPFRAYNLIWNQWFRDQNLQNAVVFGATATVYDFGDGPDPISNYALLNANKRHDYFTSGLPWTQKGGVAVSIPLVGQATVKTSASNLINGASVAPLSWLTSAAGSQPAAGGVNVTVGIIGTNSAPTVGLATSSAFTGAPTGTSAGVVPGNLYADLTTATSTAINQIRLAFQTQRLLERDARGGTRYTEIIRSHFGVNSPDMRLQRPEYLGGGKQPITIAPVPQTTGTGASGTTSPLGTLAAVGTAIARNHGFRQSFTEHGYIIGLVTVRADNIYQYGLRRMWTRATRYDFYLPVFQALGEQAIRNDEIYATGTASDTSAFAYQERWAEYRTIPSIVCGAFRSTYATPLDAWHLASKLASAPALNATWITNDTQTIMDRNLAAGSAARNNGEQFLGDFFFDIVAARPLPVYSVPGMIDHF